jgi:Domain of unknown function (DUF4351)
MIFLLRELSGQQSGLEFIETVLRYLGSAAEMPKEDLKRAVIQALPEGEQLMATPAEQWIQEGLEQGERKVLLRQVRRRFGEAAAQQSERLLVMITDPAQLEDLGEMLLECKDGAAWLTRLQAAAQDRLGQ